MYYMISPKESLPCINDANRYFADLSFSFDFSCIQIINGFCKKLVDQRTVFLTHLFKVSRKPEHCNAIKPGDLFDCLIQSR